MWPSKSRSQLFKKEVEDLHPLLNSLLPKLPHISNIEYTHGTNEMGADFVLEKIDPTLGDRDFVGVVAKVGSLQQDFTGIARQIEECSVPRFFKQGKEKIHLTEIWVVLTKVASKGAQEKIHEKYRNRKITFIPGRKLFRLIDEHLPDFWDDVVPELAEHLAQTRETNAAEDQRTSLLTSGDGLFYIDQDIYENPRSNYESNKKQRAKPKKIQLLSEIRKNDIILVEGAAGSGKSKLIRHTTSELANGSAYNELGIIPISISYHDLHKDYSGDVKNFVDAAVPAEIQALEKTTSVLVMIDALDEKEMTLEEQLSALAKLAESASTHPHIKLLITSRYLQEFKDEHLDNRVARYEIRSLSLKRTIEFIQKVCANLNLSNRIFEDLQKSQIFRELPQSPISAILLAKLIREHSPDLPSTLTELYAKYTELALGRWDIEKGLQSQQEYEVLNAVLVALARFMIENETETVSADEVRQKLEDYLRVRNLRINAPELFRKLSQRCEIVTVNKSNNTFFFRHRTFAEFFYARALLDDSSFEIDNRAFSIYWMTTYFFFLGLKKDCPDILEQLITSQPQNESERWLKWINMANYFLAAYQSPYDVVSKGILQAALDAANVYSDVVEGHLPKSPFGVVSQMQLLYLTQYFFRDSYGFSFFDEAIDTAAADIIDSKLSTETKARSIFFLNVARLELSGTDTAFTYLIDELKDGVPMDIRLAIRYESENMKLQNVLLKKHIKKLKRTARRNPAFLDSIKKMHKLPIRLTLTEELKPKEE